LPLIAAAFIAHAAGLLFGFGGVSLSALIVATVLGATAALRRDARLGALALLGAGGVLRACDRSATADTRCARQAISASPESDARVEYEAIIDDDARPRTRVMASIRDVGARCALPCSWRRARQSPGRA
jgi:hypothetical protein